MMSDAGQIASGEGKEVDHNIAQLETPALASPDDVDRAKLVDVDKDGRLPIILE